MKSVSRELLFAGLIVVIIAAALTFVGCQTSPPIRRPAALFLEPICPAGRLDGWPRIPAWYMLFSGLLWLWAVGLGSVLAGIALWLTGRGEGAPARRRADPGPTGTVGGEGEAPLREQLVVVGRESLGDGTAMTGDQYRDFELRLRRSIEQRPLDETEAMLREAIAQLGTPLLLAAIERPPASVAIEGWEAIAADMAVAREQIPPDQRHEPWRSVILALVYRNDYADMFIKPSFAFCSEMDRSGFEWRSSTMSDDQHRQWLADTRDLAALPPHPHFRAYSRREPIRLIGLEELRAVQSWTPDSADWRRLTPAISTARMLAAGIVLLRFCQVVERYLADPGLPGQLPAFLTVDMAEWPMETNTIDYCIYAVRRVDPS